MNLPIARSHFDVKTMRAHDKYYDHFYEYVNFYNLHKRLYGTEKLTTAVMQSEKITLCEINASLWISALNSATNSITSHTYPHYVIVKKIINYILNTNSSENFGLVENYFWKLLISHPPSPEMFSYYWHIMSDYFLCMNNKEIEDQTLFFFLIETITNCLKLKKNAYGKNDLSKPAIRPKLSSKKALSFADFDLQIRCSEGRENCNIIINRSSEAKVNKKQNFFEELPWGEKVKRCLIILNFVYNILETDYIFWLHSKELKSFLEDRRPLLSYLLWENPQDFGSVNKEVQKLFNLYGLAMNFNFQNIRVIDKLVTLIGEIIKYSDNIKEMTYPFIGVNSVSFCRELSFILHQDLIKNKNDLRENELIVNFKPPWLRLFLCSQLLTLMTKHQCFPELTGIFDILEYIWHTEKKNHNIRKTNKSSTTKNVSMQKRGKFKNVNTRLRNGKTYLHLACESNDREKIKTLLTFPDLEVNAVDQNGWTALHTASNKGRTTSVQELLWFRPKPGGTQKSVNTRARGPGNTTPLMCAASQGHAKICKLLLEHSGSVLLEDVNELNQTALDLTEALGVKIILQYYKNNNMWISHVYKNINIDLKFKKVIMKLCVEMIQAYFTTYRITDISKTLTQSNETVKENLIHYDGKPKWDYLNYDDRNVKKNIYKLKSLIPKLNSIKEFKSVNDVYEKMLLFSKTS